MCFGIFPFIVVVSKEEVNWSALPFVETDVDVDLVSVCITVDTNVNVDVEKDVDIAVVVENFLVVENNVDWSVSAVIVEYIVDKNVVVNDVDSLEVTIVDAIFEKIIGVCVTVTSLVSVVNMGDALDINVDDDVYGLEEILIEAVFIISVDVASMVEKTVCVEVFILTDICVVMVLVVVDILVVLVLVLVVFLLQIFPIRKHFLI